MSPSMNRRLSPWRWSHPRSWREVYAVIISLLLGFLAVAYTWLALFLLLLGRCLRDLLGPARLPMGRAWACGPLLTEGMGKT